MSSEYCNRSHNHWGDHRWSSMGYGDRVCENCGDVEYSENPKKIFTLEFTEKNLNQRKKMKVKTSEGTYNLPSGKRNVMKTITLKKIDLTKTKGCEHPDINPYKTYWVKYDNATMIGTFDKQWYGWNFSWFGMIYAGIQLSSLTDVWEVVE